MIDMAADQKDQKRIDAQISANYILHDSATLREYSDGLEYNAQRATFRPKTGSQ